MMAKYFATSLAIEKVVSDPRVISSCLPISTTSISLVGLESRSTMLPASRAARYRLPAVYFGRHFALEGGLISYGPDFVEQYRLAAGYVDRILKGEKPANWPVQHPTKLDLVINLKTAKALRLEVP